MKRIIFYKLTGAGNDFVLLDGNENTGLEITPSLASALCSRRFGVGADGILFIKDSSSYDFEMAYYNADGTTGSLCGNGARCAINYASFSGRIKGSSTKFRVNDNVYSGLILPGGLIRFDLNAPKEIKLNLNIKTGGQLVPASFVNTGSPHLVINIKNILKYKEVEGSNFGNIDDVPVKEMGSEIRYSDAFAPDGVNVNFYLAEEGMIRIRTYERGVEDETLACGTGSAATAVIAAVKEGYTSPVNLLTRGGETLTVDFKRNGDKIDALSLTGPAKIVFKGEITI